MGNQPSQPTTTTTSREKGRPRTGEQLVAVGASLLLAGLTITCSLSLNTLMNAWVNYQVPEPRPEDLYKRFLYRLFFFAFILVFVAMVVVLVTNNNRRAKQTLINLEDFA